MRKLNEHICMLLLLAHLEVMLEVSSDINILHLLTVVYQPQKQTMQRFVKLLVLVESAHFGELMA